MAPLAVVEDFEVLKEGRAGLDVRAQGVPRQQLALQRGEEALRHRVIEAVPDRSHGAADAHGLAALTEQERGGLAASVRAVNHAFAWALVPDHHLHRADYE